MFLHKLFSDRSLLFAYIAVMLVQYAFITILGGTTAVKLTFLGLAPLLFIIRVPYVNRAVIYGVLYLFFCYFIALFHGNMRFSTIGFSGMYIMGYILVYNLIHNQSITLTDFSQFLRAMIIAYGVVLILQQLCLLVGLRNFFIINLSNQHFLSLTKLPSLSLEPSHSARILTAMILCYLRCLELTNNGEKPVFKDLFAPQHRWMTILFLWSMFTMGSGTAFIGLGILCFYFIRKKTVVYILPILVLFLVVGQSLEIKQLDRALRVSSVVLTGDVKAIRAEDGSAATRIIPVINTLTMDLTKKESWIGNGVSSYEKALTSWKRTTDKIAVVEQYGLITFIVSLILIYSCMIRYIISIESLFFIILLGMSLLNVYYYWGIMMMFSIIRYFQVQQERGLLYDGCEM